ncbi:TraV family lipoprotein [Novosphingobium sp. G106]|uniref:TraV family lipoprotein n=1 Tax=Novosphingobium sp. G106 TaxID=2849500 RepID=UPI0020C4A536|nr:TraV family lipoprotein [Novosphingobium sp. G106]
MQRLTISTRTTQVLSALTGVILLGGCATLGKVMSPYSETFSCKNSDHGQCIDPAQAHADAVAGVPSRSNRAVTRDKALLETSAGSRGGQIQTQRSALYWVPR